MPLCVGVARVDEGGEADAGVLGLQKAQHLAAFKGFHSLPSDVRKDSSYSLLRIKMINIFTFSLIIVLSSFMYRIKNPFILYKNIYIYSVIHEIQLLQRSIKPSRDNVQISRLSSRYELEAHIRESKQELLKIWSLHIY